MENEEKSIADGLRELADWYEKNPAMKLPSVTIHLWPDEPAVTISELTRIIKAFGTYEKKINDHYIHVSHNFGPVPVDVMASRDYLCKKVVSWKCCDALIELIGPEAVEAFEEACRGET